MSNKHKLFNSDCYNPITGNAGEEKTLTRQTFAVQAEDEDMLEGDAFYRIALSIHVSALTCSSAMSDKKANLQCQQLWRRKVAMAFGETFLTDCFISCVMRCKGFRL